MHTVLFRHHLGLCGKRVSRDRAAQPPDILEKGPHARFCSAQPNSPAAPRDPRSFRSDPPGVVTPEANGSLETDYTAVSTKYLGYEAFHCTFRLACKPAQTWKQTLVTFVAGIQLLTSDNGLVAPTGSIVPQVSISPALYRPIIVTCHITCHVPVTHTSFQAFRVGLPEEILQQKAHHPVKAQPR
ncbi:hypothetical protein CCUS01_02276 [Colletotrichum cuscutae]|uniref:Uncharacterized protein n=1 Tax=Colletotrichum cuscutae TaxID=1209917 RepID=A0AAI9U5R8_9PEZI|nr:hypothetical protein CCUS01_02276 [Colletotrichum cuscutae]